MSPRDLATLREARALLESPGIAAQLANLVGAPVEYLLAHRLPPRATRLINSGVRAALRRSLRLATATLGDVPGARAPRTRLHTVAVAATGAAGGAFGMLGLAAELPVTTTLILRSIAEVARSEGERLDDPATLLACFEVLTMGGRSRRDDGAESGYFAARAVLAQQIAAAAEYVAAHGLMSSGAPALVQVMASVSSRFSIKIGHKVAAQSIPVIGAASGAALNALFMRHFQRMARGHFSVRRLERRYGRETVRRAYDTLEPPAHDARAP
ncbi:EcsC family protein [Luteimonas sp. Y-2-2-4F]|nr:EcsC family protein [Luteimonas sp. Y-2-2-4F]MCD9031618.1 EcsC family protein [Luteimonas sp. Y-2-2-4F]MCD9031807.1 EcsC family protein [Luteimonas sp. Y-2-2-4F]